MSNKAEVKEVCNLSDLRSFGLNPADWLVCCIRGARHFVVHHKRDRDFKLLVEVKEASRIHSVKLPPKLFRV